ncbi:hypothetical protein QQ045_015584 [Rhodiola kirilowii]
MRINHLLYADDMLVFSNAHKISFSNMLSTIDHFCGVSGQMLNPNKSKLFFSSGIREARRKTILEMTKFKEAHFPVQYLGAPPSLEKPRATLIMSVLSLVSIHTLYILLVPKVIIKGIEKLMRNFLWDKGTSTRHHWVKWESICVPKDEGGLGLRQLMVVKQCLLSKLALRFFQNQSLWAKYARDKYLHSSYSSAIWTAVQPFIRSLRRDSCWEIGRGEIGLRHFCEWLNVQLPKEATQWQIKDVINDPDIKARFICMLEGVLRDVVNNFHLSNKTDALLWRGCESGKFSTKVCYEKLRKALPKSKLFKSIWHNWLPTKISAFLWRLWHRALPTDDNASRIGFHIVSKCWCCQSSQVETSEHIFINSDLAVQIWSHLAMLFDKVIPTSMAALQTWFINAQESTFMDCLCLGLAACSLWEIWLSRNSVINGQTRRPWRKSIHFWATSLARNINAEYKPTFHRQLALDSLNVNLPGSNIKGRWTAWCPSATGLTLNMEVINIGVPESYEMPQVPSISVSIYGSNMMTSLKA